MARWYFHFRRTTTKTPVDFCIMSPRLIFFDFDVYGEAKNQTGLMN
jgi:hypothetical protein